MSLQKLIRSFRDSVSASTRGGDVPFDDEVQLYRRWADVALREERFSDALVFLAKVLRLMPDDLWARMLVAEIYHRALGDSAKALMTYEKLIAATGYDESNAYCVRAREGIRELAAAEEPVVPLEAPFQLLDEDEIPQDESGGLAQIVTG